MKKLSISIVTLLVCSLSFGQERVKPGPYNNWEVGIHAGVVHFTGEYNKFKDARFNRFNHGNSDMDIGYGSFFSHAFAVEAAQNNSNLKGSLKFMNQPNPDFETQVNEFNRNSGWNINNIFTRIKFDRKFYWYAKIGLGAIYLKDIVAATPLKGPEWKFIAEPPETGMDFLWATM